MTDPSSGGVEAACDRESDSQLQEQIQLLVDIFRDSPHVVVYTGAGISTAASIPDYRGPDGIYTRQARGQAISPCNLITASPTLTHMTLVALLRSRKVQHIVSQNCDGLHLRSGVEPEHLSEIHGNMYIEVCKNCEPPVQYVRDFDVTTKTARHRHKTERTCQCGAALHDTIVLPGETGKLEWPLNWTAALQHAERASHIVVLGSSLRVMRHYKSLWSMNRVKAKRPKVVIVNLQATSKDKQALCRINAPCDYVMGQVATKLGLDVSPYSRSNDQLFCRRTTDVIGGACAAHMKTEPPDLEESSVDLSESAGHSLSASSAAKVVGSVDEEVESLAAFGGGGGGGRNGSAASDSSWYLRTGRKRKQSVKLFGKRRRRPKRCSPHRTVSALG